MRIQVEDLLLLIGMLETLIVMPCWFIMFIHGPVALFESSPVFRVIGELQVNPYFWIFTVANTLFAFICVRYGGRRGKDEEDKKEEGHILCDGAKLWGGRWYLPLLIFLAVICIIAIANVIEIC